MAEAFGVASPWRCSIWSIAINSSPAEPSPWRRRALSRCHAKSASGLGLTDFQAAATASRHVVIAAARSTR